MVHSAAEQLADPLIVPQAGKQADLGGEHCVVGDLVHQLLT